MDAPAGPEAAAGPGAPRDGVVNPEGTRRDPAATPATPATPANPAVPASRGAPPDPAAAAAPAVVHPSRAPMDGPRPDGDGAASHAGGRRGSHDGGAVEAATPPSPADTAVLAAGTGAIRPAEPATGVGGPHPDALVGSRPADADADRLLGLVINRARLTIGETGASLVTELDDPALGAMRLAVTEGADGLILAELTVADSDSVELLKLSAERHRAAGELVSVDLRIRPEADGARQSGASQGSPGGPAVDLGSSRDGRRPDGDAPSRPSDTPPQAHRPLRARHDVGGHAAAGETRLGRTIDRTA